ncbi:MAG: phasin family protein [Wenzhouxiangellaceae bacterium]|nr:phasin family protein [Wenzhouxiangellaceae bacterium]
MSNQIAFDEIKKAQEIIVDAIDRSARVNLAAVEKMLELNKQRFSNVEFSNPADFFARQTTAVKEYAEQVNAQFEELASIGNESREQLTELSQEFAKNLDFASLFNFGQTASAAKPKAKTAKAA